MTVDFEVLANPDYYPLDSLQGPLNEVAALVDKCLNERFGNSVILLGNRSRGPVSIVNHVLADVPCKVVWLNGHLLNDSNSILKHLSWHFSTEHCPVSFSAYEQFGEHLEKISSTNPIIFVLEEIDEFALIPGQNLLYTLFEAPSNQQLPILVIGLTEKYDFISMLEKRVKSRFSQHVIAASEPNQSFEAYCTALLAAMCPPEAPKAIVDKTKVVLKNKAVEQALRQCFMHTPNLHYAASKLVTLLPTKAAGLTAKAVASALMSGHSPSLKDLLDSASEPMILLLIALNRLEERSHGQQSITFETVLDECYSMMKSADQNQIGQAFKLGRETFQLAWCSLIDLGIISCTPNSWVNQQIDNVSLVEPLTDLYANLPDGCPKHIKDMAKLV